MVSVASAQDILDFWFVESDSSLHFNGGDVFDKEIEDRFMPTIEAAKACELWTWRKTSKGRLAEIIVLDQFSRNVFRGDPRSFSSDDMACSLTQELMQQEDFEDLSQEEKSFALMPLMHSESAKVHEELSLPAFEKLGSNINLKYEIAHKEQIDRFGRYPFRNEVLNRESTPEEKEFMANNHGF